MQMETDFLCLSCFQVSQLTQYFSPLAGSSIKISVRLLYILKKTATFFSPLLRHPGRGNKQNTSGTPQLPLLIYHQIEMEDIYLNCFEAQQPIFFLMLGLTQTQASAS